MGSVYKKNCGENSDPPQTNLGSIWAAFLQGYETHCIDDQHGV